MINLDNYPIFKSDIQGKTTNVHPVVVIRTSPNPIYISQNKEIIYVQGEPVNFLALDLKIPSIKESLDIFSKKLKINTVEISLSNHTNFSNLFSSTALFNVTVDIYWKSASCVNLYDCALVYKGVIKRFSHGDKNVRITLEDKTESVIHAKVPTTLIPKTAAYSNKYVNKVVPMTFGVVDKATAVLWNTQEYDTDSEKYLFVIPDRIDKSNIGDNEMHSGHSVNENITESNLRTPLCIYDSIYAWIPKDYTFKGNILGDAYPNRKQWEMFENKIRIVRAFNEETFSNSMAENIAQVVINRNCVSASIPELYHSAEGKIYNYYGSSDGIFIENSENIITNNNDLYFYGEDFISVWDTFVEIPNNQIESLADIEQNEEGWVSIQNLYSSSTDTHKYLPFYGNELTYTGDVSHGDLQPPFFEDYSINSTPLSSIKKTYIYPNGSKVSGHFEFQNCLSHFLHEHSNQIELITLPDSKKIYDYFVSWIQSEHPHLIDSVLPWNTGYHQWTALHIPTYAPTDNDMLNEFVFVNLYKIQMQVTSDTPDGWAYILFSKNAFGEENTIDYSQKISPNIVANLNFWGYPFSEEKSIQRLSPNEVHSTNIYNNLNVEFWDLISMEYNSGRIYGNENLDIPRYKIEELTNAETYYNNFPVEAHYYNGDQQFKRYGYNAFWNGVDINVWGNTGAHGGYFNQNAFGDENRFIQEEDGVNQNGGFCSTIHYKTQDVAYPNFKHTTSRSSFLWSYEDNAYPYISSSVDTSNPADYNWNHFYSRQNNWWVLFKEDVPIGQDSSHLHYNSNVPRGHLQNMVMQYLPMVEYNYPDATLNQRFAGCNYTTGTIDSTVGGYLFINEGAGSTVENRIAVVYGVEDAGISDVIDDTGTAHFWGKIEVAVQEDSITINSNPSFLKAELFECDLIGSSDEEEETGDALQQHLDSIGIGDIISEDLSSIIDSNYTPITFNSYLDNTEAFSEFWKDPSNFNAASIRFWVSQGSASLRLKLHHLGIKNIVDIGNIFDKDFYVNSTGRKLNGQDIQCNNPVYIIEEIIKGELGVDVQTDYAEIISSLQSNWNLAFSIKEQVDSKKLIEDIAKSYPLIPYFKYDFSNSEADSHYLSFVMLKEEYSSNEQFVILSKDVYSFSFSRTPIENVKTMVRVAYKKDYALNEYSEITNYSDAYDLFGNKDRGYVNGYSKEFIGLNPETPEDSVLEFKSDFIRDLNVANRLRDYLIAFNCNQHTILNLSLPLKYVNLEIGDVVKLDSLINGTLAYGEDYTQSGIKRNGQEIYPYFIITSVSKNTKSVNIECFQLHKLTRTEGIIETGNGDISRAGQPPTAEDLSKFEDFLMKYRNYITQGQMQNLDMNYDGLLNFSDYSMYAEEYFGIIEEEDEEVVEVGIETTVLQDNLEFIATLDNNLTYFDGSDDPAGLDTLGNYFTFLNVIFEYPSGSNIVGQAQDLQYLIDNGYANIMQSGGNLQYPFFPTYENWYIKIGTEWFRAVVPFPPYIYGKYLVERFVFRDSGFPQDMVDRGLFTDPSDLENYDSNAASPYAHSVGELVKFYSSKPTFINEVTTELGTYIYGDDIVVFETETATGIRYDSDSIESEGVIFGTGFSNATNTSLRFELPTPE